MKLLTLALSGIVLLGQEKKEPSPVDKDAQIEYRTAQAMFFSANASFLASLSPKQMELYQKIEALRQALVASRRRVEEDCSKNGGAIDPAEEAKNKLVCAPKPKESEKAVK